MQIYIDANIYLEYFKVNSKERLAPLKELVKLVEEKKVLLLITTQTLNEYYRNRQSLAELTRVSLVEQSKFAFKAPAIMDANTPEIKEIKRHLKDFTKSIKNLITEYDKAVEVQKTDADVLIEKLFKLAKVLEENDEIIKKAHTRYMKGNPPRKNDYSFGDAITWETLLSRGNKDNLVLVTRDTDFIVKVKGVTKLNKFLETEWKTIKGKKAQMFTSLAETVNFLNKKKPVKHEIVENEKSLPLTTGLNLSNNSVIPLSQTLNRFGINDATIVGGNIISTASILGNSASSYSVLGNISNQSHILSICPNCYTSMYEGVDKRLHCPTCGLIL